MLNEMVSDEMSNATNKGQTRMTSMRTDVFVTIISRKNLRFQIQEEVKSNVWSTQRVEMINISRILDKEIVCNLFATGYLAVLQRTKSFSLAFVKNTTKKVV